METMLGERGVGVNTRVQGIHTEDTMNTMDTERVNTLHTFAYNTMLTTMILYDTIGHQNKDGGISDGCC